MLRDNKLISLLLAFNFFSLIQAESRRKLRPAIKRINSPRFSKYHENLNKLHPRKHIQEKLLNLMKNNENLIHDAMPQETISYSITFEKSKNIPQQGQDLNDEIVVKILDSNNNPQCLILDNCSNKRIVCKPKLINCVNTERRDSLTDNFKFKNLGDIVYQPDTQTVYSKQFNSCLTLTKKTKKDIANFSFKKCSKTLDASQMFRFEDQVLSDANFEYCMKQSEFDSDKLKFVSKSNAKSAVKFFRVEAAKCVKTTGKLQANISKQNEDNGTDLSNANENLQTETQDESSQYLTNQKQPIKKQAQGADDILIFTNNLLLDDNRNSLMNFDLIDRINTLVKQTLESINFSDLADEKNMIKLHQAESISQSINEILLNFIDTKFNDDVIAFVDQSDDVVTESQEPVLTKNSSKLESRSEDTQPDNSVTFVNENNDTPSTADNTNNDNNQSKANILRKIFNTLYP